MPFIDTGNLGAEGGTGSVWSMLHLMCFLDIQMEIGCTSQNSGQTSGLSGE